MYIVALGIEWSSWTRIFIPFLSVWVLMSKLCARAPADASKSKAAALTAASVCFIDALLDRVNYTLADGKRGSKVCLLQYDGFASHPPHRLAFLGFVRILS